MPSATFYPQADPASTADDGLVSNLVVAVWSTCHDAATGSAASTSGANLISVAQLSGGNYSIRRAFFLFDTSTLGSNATITSATLSLQSEGTAPDNADTTTVDIISTTPASNTTLGTGDYNKVGTTVFATMNLSSWNSTAGTYNNFTLDANGLANISKTGVSKFGARIGRDTANSAPTGLNTVTFKAADAGANVGPKLVVNYTLPATGNLFAFF